MKKWLIYVLGIITGVVLTVGFVFALAFCVNMHNKSGIVGLEMFDEPGEVMDYSQFEVFQVVDAGCALANADDDFGSIVFIIPDDEQKFYDDQKIVLKGNQCAQRVGTYRYSTKAGIERTVPAVKITDDVKSASDESIETKNDSGKTFFDKPGDCVSRKGFEVQQVLESGDAIALEIREEISGYAITSDLEVLILAQDGSNFYNNQIVRVPKGKCARQIGNYKYEEYGTTKVIPIVAIN